MRDPDFQWKSVAWVIKLGNGGKYIGSTGTHFILQEEGKKKPKPQAKDMRIPYQPGRSGKKAPANFFVDNAKYVFGLPTKDKSFSEEEGKKKSEEFRKRVKECVDETKDEYRCPSCRLHNVKTFIADRC